MIKSNSVVLSKLKNTIDDLFVGIIRYTDLSDLTKDQVITTQIAYKLHAQDYALKYEHNKSVIERAIPNTVLPFLNFYKKFSNKSPILFAGCGSCRDLQYCEKKGYKVIGIDTSEELLDIARDFGVKSQLSIGDITDFRPQPNSLGGIFCDTALSHIPKSSLPNILQNFNNALERNGILFIELRQGNGNVYYTIDEFGERYYTTFSKEEAVRLLTENSFDIQSIHINKHPFSSRPKFIAIIASKK